MAVAAADDFTPKGGSSLCCREHGSIYSFPAEDPFSTQQRLKPAQGPPVRMTMTARPERYNKWVNGAMCAFKGTAPFNCHSFLGAATDPGDGGNGEVVAKRTAAKTCFGAAWRREDSLGAGTGSLPPTAPPRAQLGCCGQGPGGPRRGGARP